MGTRIYTLWAVAVLALLGTAQYRGWSLTRASESYRPTYFIPGRTLRGK